MCVCVCACVRVCVTPLSSRFLVGNLRLFNLAFTTVHIVQPTPVLERPSTVQHSTVSTTPYNSHCTFCGNVQREQVTVTEGGGGWVTNLPNHNFHNDSAGLGNASCCMKYQYIPKVLPVVYQRQNNLPPRPVTCVATQYTNSGTAKRVSTN